MTLHVRLFGFTCKETSLIKTKKPFRGVSDFAKADEACAAASVSIGRVGKHGNSHSTEESLSLHVRISLAKRIGGRCGKFIGSLR